MSAELARIFAPLDRLAPGSAATVARALTLAGTAPDARVLDAGCGTGADVPALLAGVPRGNVVAMDMLPDFTAALSARIADPRLTVLTGDMTDPPGVFDLIWAMGAAYAPGVQATLDAWRRHLAPGGRIALSDLVWRTASPSAEARAYWAEDYPEIADEAGFMARIDRAEYQVLGHFWQDPSDWAAYYDPVAARLEELADQGADRADPAMAEAMAGLAREVALWRAHGQDYGYLMAVIAPR